MVGDVGPPEPSVLLAPPVPVGPPEPTPLEAPPVPELLIITEIGPLGVELGPPDPTALEAPPVPVPDITPDTAKPELNAVPKLFIIVVADVDGADPPEPKPLEAPPVPPELIITVCVEKAVEDVIALPLTGPPPATPVPPPVPLPLAPEPERMVLLAAPLAAPPVE